MDKHLLQLDHAAPCDKMFVKLEDGKCRTLNSMTKIVSFQKYLWTCSLSIISIIVGYLRPIHFVTLHYLACASFSTPFAVLGSVLYCRLIGFLPMV